MNISTYEARIAALEAQQGPEPGPVQETGVISITVHPDILLNNGNTLNDKLSLLMPSTKEGQIFSDHTTDTAMEKTYNITVVPGSAWYGFVGNAIGEEPGQPVTGSVTLNYEQDHEHLAVNAGALSDPHNESAPYLIVSIDVSGVLQEG